MSAGPPIKRADGPTALLLPKDGERRHVTVLLADLAGFTAFTARAGEEHAFALMQRLSNLMNFAVQEQGCTIKNFTGDGIIAFFGAPAAFEDAPLRACRAALLISRRLAEASDEIEARHGMRPQLRMSINSGLVVFGQVTEGEAASVTAHGDVVNLGSRMLSAAEPGTILVGEETQRLVEGMVESRPAGTFRFKGKDEPQRTYRLLALREAATRFTVARRRGLTEYVNRENERHLLDAKLRQLDSVSVVDIAGEPGIGKSRLLHEFRSRLRGEPAVVLSGTCLPDGKQVPLRPFVEVVHRAFRLGGYEAHATLCERICAGLSRFGLDSSQNCDLLLHLLGAQTLGALDGLDGTLVGILLRELLVRLLKELCSRSKVIFLLEDVHWIDNASEDLLMRIIGLNGPLPLLIVHTRRPEYHPPWYGWPMAVPLVLGPLSNDETLRIVSTRLGIAEVPQSLGQLIAQKAEGNALFAEEITSLLVERGNVRLTGSGLTYHTLTVATAIPASLQLLIMTRVDRLPAGDRLLLQAGAVIGRRFELSLLAAITNAPEGDVAQGLAAMQDADLIYHDESCNDYVFKHALVREALCDSLLRAARVQLHLKTAQEIERTSSGRLTEVAEILAYHYSIANEPDPAFRYLCLAGRKCLDIYSLEEAQHYFRQALTTYESNTKIISSVAAAVVGLLESLYLSGNVLETKRVAELYIPHLEHEGPSPELVFALYFLSLMLANLCLFHEGAAKARQALAVAERTGNVKAMAYARSCLFFLTTVLGQTPLEAMEAMGARLVADCEKASDNYSLNWAYWSIAWDYMCRGLDRKARLWVAKLIESGRERKDRRALGLGHWALGWIEIFAGDYAGAARDSEEALKAAVAPYDQNAANHVNAVAMLLQGRIEEALERLLLIRQWAVDNGWLYLVSGTNEFIAPALALGGDLRSAVALLKTSIKSADASGNRTIGSVCRIILAELYLGVLTRASRPTLRVVLRNFATILSITLFGGRQARSLLLEARCNEQFAECGTFVARIELDLGKLARRAKRPGEAHTHFVRARAAAEAQGAAIMVREIDAAIAALD